MRVTVAEGKHQRVNFGVGYGTEEKARVDAEYHHVNFLGGARLAGAHARWSSLDRGIRLDFNQPYFLRAAFLAGRRGPAVVHVHARVSIDRDRRQDDGHAPNATSGRRGRSSLTSERNSSSISEDALNDPTLRDDLIALGLDPGHGQPGRHAERAGLRPAALDRRQPAERAPRLSARVPRRAGRPPGARHVQLLRVVGRRPALPADRLQGGRSRAGCSSATSARRLNDPGNVPFSKKYFLGGATSIRGWGRYEVSPLSESGLPIGGNSMLAFSAEVRAR